MAPRPPTFTEQIALLLDRQPEGERDRAEAAIAEVLRRVSARLTAEAFKRPPR